MYNVVGTLYVTHTTVTYRYKNYILIVLYQFNFQANQPIVKKKQFIITNKILKINSEF